MTIKAGAKAPLKNRQSRSTRIVETIRDFLVNNGALDVNFRHDPTLPPGSKPVSVTFSLVIDGRELYFRMTAKYDQVRASLLEDAQTLTQRQRVTRQLVEQVTWANIRDWLAAQVTMMRIGQMKMHEVFLSQMLEYNGPQARTMFQVVEENKYLLSETTSKVIEDDEHS